MENQSNGLIIPLKLKVADDKLRNFFIMHLNRIYCAKTYLAKQLPEIEDMAVFRDLKLAIEETTSDIKIQILRMRKIYALLDAKISINSFKGITGLIQDTFSAVKQQHDDEWQRDMSILFYLQIIESIEMASFQLLELATAKLKNAEISQLLKENYDEAKQDRALLLLITAKYINKNT